MIDKTAIRALANQASYTRGKNLYQSGNVLEFSVDDTTEIHFIEAVVLGSTGQEYKVYIQYDTNMQWTEESDCECPAFQTYPGLCKHQVAVLLAYEDYEKRQKIMLDDEKKEAANLAFLESLRGTKGSKGKKKEILSQTTPGIKKLLLHQQLKTTLPVLREDIYEKVSLRPFFTYEEDGCYLELKIGTDYMYVLKDVFHFARLMEEQGDYAYGQKLHFVHTMNVFTKESRKLVSFVVDWAKENKEHYTQLNYYGHAYGIHTTAKLRKLPLSFGDVERFLEAMGYEEFEAKIKGDTATHWHQTVADLNRNMSITGNEHGIQIKVNYMTSVKCLKHYIYFDQGKIYQVPKSQVEPIQGFLDCIEELPERTIFVETGDIPAFCKELLPVLKEFYHITNIEFDEKDYSSAPVFFEVYLDAPQKNFISCKVLAVYGEETYNLYDKETELERRDLLREAQMSKLVSSYCNAYDEQEQVMVLAEDEDLLYQLLIYGIPEMQNIAEVYISDTIRKINVSPAPKVNVGLSLVGDLLNLEMSSEDMSREQLLEILSKYDRRKKYYRLKNGDFVNMDGEGINALIEMKDGLNLTQKDLKQEVVSVPKYRALYLDGEVKQWQDVSSQKDKAFRSLIRNMKTVDDNDFEIPASMRNILREYQKRGYLWLKTLKHNGFGGILADDMGLGKTLQVITFLESERLEGKELLRSLIVVPASLVFNWESEIKRFAPELSVKMVVGNAEQRKEILEEVSKEDILITSYDLLRRDRKQYEELTFANQIIDEAQFIKNHNTQSAKAVKKIHAGFKVALTGTPIENRLSELWSIFDYLMSGFLYTYKKFREEFEQPIIQDNSEDELRRLQKMIRPFVLRRLKKDVLQDLPDKLEKNYFAKMDTEQQELYDAHVKRMQLMLDRQSDEEFRTSKLQILSELMRLRQICCHPNLIFENYTGESVKMDLCMDLIQNGISGGHKILLFSQFTSMLSLLEERMKEEGISFYTLTGAVKKEKRNQMVEAFNHDDTSVFCISLKAGGTGLNLTAADMVIHYDPWWNLAVQNQATDRAHRIGQENVVMVYKLIVQGTIEDNILKLQEKKKELAEHLLSGDGMGRGSFTKEELRELLE